MLRKKKYYYLYIISVLLTVIGIIGICSDWWGKNIYRALFLFGLLWFLLLFLKERNKKPPHKKRGRISPFLNSLEYFLLPFYQYRSQIIKVVWLFISLFILPYLIILVYNDFQHPNFLSLLLLLEGDLDEKSFIGWWFAFLGIIFTIRVYLEFVNNDKHSLAEFLMLVNNFLDKTSDEDEIKIIMPTLFIGALTEPNFFHSYKRKLLHISKRCEVHLGFLDYKDLNRNSYKNMNPSEFNKLDNEISTEALFKFHNRWFPLNNAKLYADRKKYFENLLTFLLEIEKINNSSDYQCTIDKLTKKYFESETGKETNEDLFIFANITKGIAYLGQMKVISQTNIWFEASLIENINLAPYFSEIYDSFIKKKQEK